MTASAMFAPPTARRPVVVWVGLGLAVLVATFLLSNFIDTLHLSMARGEAMRNAHRLAPATGVDSRKPILLALAPLRKANR